MQFKITNWDFSNTVAKEEKPVSEGKHLFYIEGANYNGDQRTYSVTLRSVDTDECSEFRFFMFNKDMTPNNRSIGTLNSLKKALTGVGDGVLYPTDTVHGVVRAEVKMSKPNEKGNVYPNIYRFDPVSESDYQKAEDYFGEVIEQYVERSI